MRAPGTSHNNILQKYALEKDRFYRCLFAESALWLG